VVFGRSFVCQSVTLAYHGQAVGWIKMPLGMMVGLGHGQIALDWDRANPHLHPPEKGVTAPNFRHVFYSQTVAHHIYCWALVRNLYTVVCIYVKVSLLRFAANTLKL